MPQKTAAAKSKNSKTQGLTAAERAAMRDLIKERKANANKAELEKAALAAINAMKGTDRALAQKIHGIATAAGLEAKTWYGMPAYTKNDKVVCFFKPALKFKSRYATFGFEDAAKLDEGGMWPTSYALTNLTAADEKKITALVKKAAG